MPTEARSLKELFLAALAVPPAERAAWVARECDADLRQHLDQMLAAHDTPQSLLDRPVQVQDPSSDATGAFLAESTGTMIGPYKLLEQIGEGGFGVVFMAEQTEPVRRKVALKILKPGMDTRQVVARFEAERQALAIMDHPNIAKVFDGGATPSGRPYFVMELVKGVPITAYCDQNHLMPRQRLELFLPVLQAIQHAHQKGIIHRDLKPSNLLVSRHDATPVVKVIDFGVAKALGQELTDKTLFTGIAQMVGTPLYMSPEQAGMSDLDVDTRSDIYSLGVLLYELLTGTTPFSKERFQQAGYDEIRRMIKEEEPPKPSTRLSDSGEALASISANRHTEPAKLTKLVKGELDWIVMKTLEKDRNRRYETANGFAADVQRYLADEPVQACPPSTAYRLRKFVRRNKRTLMTAALLSGMLAVTLGVVGWQVQQSRSRQLAAERRIAVTAAGVNQALARAEAIRRELHAELKKPGGVRQMLNQPARWQLYLKTARAELDRAKDLAGETDAGPMSEATGELRQIERELAADDADYRLALRLDGIRLDTATVVQAWFDHAQAGPAYALAFEEAGIQTESGREQEAADLIGKSPIKEQLLAALDDWAWNAFLYRNSTLCNRLVTVARLADPDPWRDQIRDPTLWGQTGEILQMAEQIGRNPDRLARMTPQALLLIGSLLRDETAQRQVWLRTAQALHPADFWISFQLASDLHASKETRVEAIGFYRAALALRPHSEAVYVNLSYTFHAQKNLPAAVDAMKKALAINPKLPKGWMNLGLCLSKQKDFPAAIDAYRRAVTLDPKLSVVWSNLGGALLKSNDLPAALAALEKALAIDAQDAWAWDQLGIARRSQGDLVAAIAAHKKALAVDPQNASAWGNLGIALRAQGDRAAAIDAYKKSLAIKPESASAWDCLGIALAEQKDFAAALDAHKKAIGLLEPLVQKFPGDADHQRDLGGALHNLASVLKRQAKFIECRPLLERALICQQAALKLDPKDDLARSFLQNHYRLLGPVLVSLSEHLAAHETANTLARSFSEAAPAVYDASCIVAQCALLAEKDTGLSQQQRQQLVKSYADRGMDLLRQAVKVGWHNAEHMKGDSDLDPLRSRDDFKQLMAELDIKKRKGQ